MFPITYDESILPIAHANKFEKKIEFKNEIKLVEMVV